MKNRASSHLLILLALIVIEIVGYVGIHRAALIRGYDTSWIGAARDLFMYLPIMVLVLWRHRSNFSRLLNGTEQRFRRK